MVVVQHFLQSNSIILASEAKTPNLTRIPLVSSLHNPVGDVSERQEKSPLVYTCSTFAKLNIKLVTQSLEHKVPVVTLTTNKSSLGLHDSGLVHDLFYKQVSSTCPD